MAWFRPSADVSALQEKLDDLERKHRKLAARFYRFETAVEDALSDDLDDDSDDGEDEPDTSPPTPQSRVIARR